MVAYDEQFRRTPPPPPSAPQSPPANDYHRLRRRPDSLGNASCAVAFCNLLESFGNKERPLIGLVLSEQV